jgi:hypothetical protein
MKEGNLILDYVNSTVKLTHQSQVQKRLHDCPPLVKERMIGIEYHLYQQFQHLHSVSPSLLDIVCTSYAKNLLSTIFDSKNYDAAEEFAGARLL